MYPTRNTLNRKVREDSVALIQDRLSDGLDVLSQTKQAHWNVKGGSFIALHKLFDEIHDSAREWVDLMAERIVQLGGIAIGTVRATANRSKMPEYPMNVSDGLAHTDALAETLSAFGEHVRIACDEAERFGDVATADIFTEINREVDKYLWMVEAHNQEGQSFIGKQVA